MRIIEAEKLNWIELQKPKKKDIDWLKKKFELHPLVLKDLLPPLDYPKVENFGDYLFLVLFYPFFDKKTQETIPLELDIIVGKNYLITNHYQSIVPLKVIFDQCNTSEELRQTFTDEGPAELLYRIINEILSACFPKLSNIKERIDKVEKTIFSGQYKKAVKDIAITERDIIGFQRIMEPQKLVLEKLPQEIEKLFGKKPLPYFHSLSGSYERIKTILKTHQNTLTSLNSTNQSLLSTKINEIIKLLTIFSVIVFPLTLIAGIFGMNTKYLPIVGKPGDFWIITGIMMAGVIAMICFFKKKKWI
jgi:magnesium transporter